MILLNLIFSTGVFIHTRQALRPSMAVGFIRSDLASYFKEYPRVFFVFFVFPSVTARVLQETNASKKLF